MPTVLPITLIGLTIALIARIRLSPANSRGRWQGKSLHFWPYLLCPFFAREWVHRTNSNTPRVQSFVFPVTSWNRTARVFAWMTRPIWRQRIFKTIASPGRCLLRVPHELRNVRRH